MITKRSISKPDSSKKEEPGEIAIKQTMTSHHRIARVHYPVLKPPRAPTGPDPRPARPTASRQGHPENRTHPKRMRVAVREPKSISAPLPAGPKDPRSQRSLPHQHAHARPETIPGTRATRRTPDRRPEKLRRKEVIQPHLPIRLPCYDFTPVIGPAFGSSFFAVRSLTSGVTDSHGVTGGVYKTRERIHRDILIRDY